MSSFETLVWNPWNLENEHSYDIWCDLGMEPLYKITRKVAIFELVFSDKKEGIRLKKKTLKKDKTVTMN